MATLTETASLARRLIKFGAILFIGLIFFRVSYQAFTAWWKATHPSPPPPPTVAFQTLARPQFPASPQGELNFILELPTVDFPPFPDRGSVFLMPYKKASFGAWDEAIAQAAALGFSNKPQQLSEEVYRWQKQSPITSTLELNIVDGSFEYNYNWQEDQTLLDSKQVSQEQAAISEAKSFLNRAKRLDEDLVQAETKVTYFKVAGTKLLPAMSFSESDFVKVDFFRAKIDQLPVMTPDPARGIISVLMSGASDRRFLKVTNNYYPVSYSVSATYPIKSATAAWEDLRLGKGYLAHVPDNQTNIVVRRVYLGFYDNFSPQPYLQPIYIFAGDNDFVGYVPAIIDSWYQ